MLQSDMVTALGTMSGTSLDGVDAAIVVTDGIDIAGFGPTMYRPYSVSERAVLRSHLGQWQSDDVGRAANVVENAHIEVMRAMGHVDLAAFHGQTLAHDPSGRGTHQCGDGARIASALGCPVVWDFRSNDVAAGGQGAPLAPFYHFALAKWMEVDAPIAFLNLGGVGNITWIDPSKDDAAAAGALLAFDTGPANAPINDEMMRRFGVKYDAGGVLAASGTVDHHVIQSFMAHPFFDQTPPKSLDRDAFVGLSSDATSLSDADAIATLTQAVVASVSHAISQCPTQPTQLFVTGGGRRNATVMRRLATVLTCGVNPVEDAGLNGDMLEAQAFAYLAVRSSRGLPLSAPMTTGIPHPTTGGRLSKPASHD